MNYTLHLWRVVISDSYDYGKGWSNERRTHYVATNSQSVEDLRISIQVSRNPPYSWGLVVDSNNPAVYLGTVHLI